MNNRLGDLPAWAMEDSDGSDDDVPKPSKNGGDIEMQNQEKDEHKQYMENFFREVDSIKADIDAVAQASKDIAKINEQSMRATTTSEEQKLSKQLKPLIENTNKRAKRTKNLLGLLKEETDQLKAQGKLNASDIRYVCCFFLSHEFIVKFTFSPLHLMRTCISYFMNLTNFVSSTPLKKKCPRKHEHYINQKVRRRNEDLSTVTATVQD
jgi:hypothetical protein